VRVLGRARSRRPRARAAVLAAAVVTTILGTAGCGPQEAAQFEQPECRADNATMVLMAQAIPTATLLPCIRGLPTGWTFNSLDIHNGKASFWLDNDRAGIKALGVSLQRTCVPRGTPAPSDKPGSQLYVKIDSLNPRFAGTRFYRFPQECLIYEFTFPAEDRSFFTTDATNAIGFVTRAQVGRYVARYGFTL